MSSSSARVNTFPVGLWGVLRTMAAVFLLNARANSFSSMDQSGSRKVTYTGFAPGRLARRVCSRMTDSVKSLMRLAGSGDLAGADFTVRVFAFFMEQP